MTLVDHDSGGRFLDKQWMAVDVPRANGQVCVFDAPQDSGLPVRQGFLGGRIYVVYTAFSGSGSSMTGQILFSQSSDCGLTWSRPRDLTSYLVPGHQRRWDRQYAADLNVVRASFGKRCGDAQVHCCGRCERGLPGRYSRPHARLAKCGQDLSDDTARVPQGATLAIHPLTGAVYASRGANSRPAHSRTRSSSRCRPTSGRPLVRPGIR